MGADSVMPAPLAYKDRRAGCVVFGALEILAGAACLLAIPLTFALAAMVSTPLGRWDQITTVATCMIASASCIWLGVGSILCRRWARTLLLIVASSTLVATVTFSVALVAIVLVGLPWAFAGGAAAEGALVLAVLIALAVLLNALPLAMVVFYRSRHVRATCEARDPVPRWTDACPVPVLTTALWFAIGGILELMTVASERVAFPCFGRIISGPPAVLGHLITVGLCLWLAWAFYRLQRNAIWMCVALTTVGALSLALTVAGTDSLAFYRLVGYPEQQIDRLHRAGALLDGSSIAWLMGLMGAATIAFLLWLRRYFPSRAQDAL
jgi:hypothetical protein